MICEYFGKNEAGNKTALHIAVKESDVKIVELLLSSQKIDVNIKISGSYDFYGDNEQAALHIAVKNKNIEIIQLLLNHQGIDLDAVDKYGKKPIDYADDEEIKKLFNKENA